MNKLVSVVVPTYKGSDCVVKNIDKIFLQSYAPIEIIVVDDNGKESDEQLKTEEALDGYIKSGRIKYVAHEKNKNGAAARNTGAAHAKGEYIIFIDDDDYLAENQIEMQVKQLENLTDDWGASYCSCVVMKDNQQVNFIKAEQSGAILYDYLMKKIWIGTGSVLLRKKTFDEIGGYDETYQRHQDWEFNSRLLNQYKMIACDDTYFIRNHTFRNYTTNLNNAEEQMDHFIKGLHKNVTALSEKQITQIIILNYTLLALRFLRTKDFHSFYRIVNTKCHGIKAVPVMIKQYSLILYKIATGKRYQ